MPGNQLLVTVSLDPVELSTCEMGTVRLSEVIVSDEDAMLLSFCGSVENPCPAEEEPSPPMMPSLSTLFPCTPVGPCEDDPTFLIFGTFPCDMAPFDPCGDAQASSACALTCLTCEICEDPVPIMGVDVIFQYEIVDGENLVIFIDNLVPVSGIEAGVFCESNGKNRSVSDSLRRKNWDSSSFLFKKRKEEREREEKDNS